MKRTPRWPNKNLTSTPPKRLQNGWERVPSNNPLGLKHHGATVCFDFFAKNPPMFKDPRPALGGGLVPGQESFNRSSLNDFFRSMTNTKPEMLGEMVGGMLMVNGLFQPE